MAQRCLATVALALATGLTGAHGGGLNAEGCHNNRKTGDYHCHRAPTIAAPQVQRAVPASKPRAAANTQAGKVAPAARTGPTCYAGPRGGTYTITASGRKNYGGC